MNLSEQEYNTFWENINNTFLNVNCKYFKIALQLDHNDEVYWSTNFENKTVYCCFRVNCINETERELTFTMFPTHHSDTNPNRRCITVDTFFVENP